MKTFLEFSNDKKLGTIYLDMDGVLCDFIGRVKELTGEDFGSPSLDRKGKTELKSEIHSHKKFWHEMKWMPGGEQLYKFVKPFRPQILSAYADWDKNSIPGKYEWNRVNTGISKQRINLVRRSEKLDYAVTDGVQNILIDDYIKNIREFEKAGGIGIHHIDTATTISKLKKIGF